MKIAYRRLFGFAACLWTSSCFTSVALAQSIPAGLPAHQTIDANGVDLIAGTMNISEPALTIGIPGQSGLARTSSLGVDSYQGTITDDFTYYYVSVGSTTEKFNVSNLAPAQGQGSTLTLNNAQTTFTYTAEDGSIYTFTTPYIGEVDTGGGDAILSSVLKPTGEVLTYYYATVQINLGNGSFYQGRRIQSVTSNLGWILKYDYAGRTASTFTTRTRVTMINTAAEPNYCNPNSDGCTLTYAWPYLSYATSGAIQDALGRTTSYPGAFSYTLPSGAHVTTTFNSAGRVSSLTNGVGTFNYSYSDSNGVRTTTVTDPLGHTRVVKSTLATLLTNSDTDGNGNTTSYAYDTYGRLTQVTRPEGDATQYAYDVRGNITQTILVPKPGSGQSSISTSATYPQTCTNAVGSPGGNPVTCNQPTATFDALGNETDYTYDSTHGGVTNVTLPAPTSGGVRPKTTYTYSQVPTYAVNSSNALAQSGLIWALTATSTCQTQSSCAGTSDELKTTYSYSGSTNLLLTSVTAGAGDGSLTATSSVTYDGIGNVLTVTGPLGSATTTRYRYDAARQLIGIVGPDPDGSGPLLNRAVRLSYTVDGLNSLTEFGAVNSQSDADWANFNSLQQQATSYNAVDLPSQASFAAGGSTFSLRQMSYDAANHLICAAQRLNASAFSSLPSSACTLGTAGSYGPDRITAFTYDAGNRLTQTTTGYATASPTNTATIGYGVNGETLSARDANGNLTSYSYDGFNRPIRIFYPAPTTGSGASNPNDYEAFTYDADSRVTTDRRRDGQTITLGYDNLSRLTSDLVGASYSYDNFGRVKTVSFNGQTVTRSYDALSRLLSESGPFTTANGQPVGVSYQYDLAGRRTRLTWADGFYVTYGFDNADEVTSITDSASVSLATYSYDNLGRRTGIGRGNNVATAYGFDSFSNLTSLAHTLTNASQNQTLTLGYNPAGEIATRTASNDAYAYTGATAVNRAYTLNGLNQVTASGPLSLSYDGRANLYTDGVNTFTYDVANRLTGMSGTATLSYDPLGRIAKTVGSSTTQFKYDGDEITAEYDGSGNLLRRYVRGPSEDQPIAWYEGSGTANRQWLLENPQGSIIAVTNSSGAATTINAYDEYGLPGSGNSGRFQYTGQAWIPEVGLYNYKARIYSPNLGRFMQTDPIGYGDGMNIYAYVHGDPVNLFDPTGTDGDPTGPDIVVHAQPNPDDSGSLADLTNLSRPTYAPVLPLSNLAGAPSQLTVHTKPKPKPGSCAFSNDSGCVYVYDVNGKLQLSPEYAKKACDNYHAMMRSQDQVSKWTSLPGLIGGGVGSFGGRFALGAFGWSLSIENYAMKFAPPPPGCSK